MQEVTAAHAPFGRFDQIGMVVRDIETAMSSYKSLGIGPFKAFGNTSVVEKQVNGRVVPPDSVRAKIMMARWGGVELELIQPVAGNSPWQDFLDSQGEGVQHFGFFVDDINLAEDRLLRQGYRLAYRSRFGNGDGAAYFDVSGLGGVMLELIQRAPEFRM